MAATSGGAALPDMPAVTGNTGTGGKIRFDKNIACCCCCLLASLEQVVDFFVAVCQDGGQESCTGVETLGDRGIQPPTGQPA